jgi:hypothetical protein
MEALNSLDLCQAFLVWSNVSGQGQEPSLDGITIKVLHSGRPRPYSQTLDQDRKDLLGTNTLAYLPQDQLRRKDVL